MVGWACTMSIMIRLSANFKLSTLGEAPVKLSTIGKAHLSFLL